MTSFSSSAFLPCPAESSSGGIIDKRKRKKRLIRLQVHPYRDSLTGIIIPVRKNL